MNKTIHKSDSRGSADYGWLQSRHSFSFSTYHNPQRMGFGKLRVINDDIVQPGGGFGTHPHDNMEIVSVPLSGALRHQDSMGNVHTIREGEVQIMSAGRGLTHSEFNASDTDAVNFLQIWILPKQLNIEPRYGQQAFVAGERRNRFQTVVSPDGEAQSVVINQDAWLSLGDFDAKQSGVYKLRRAGNGVYLFVIDGDLDIETESLTRRDAIGLEGMEKICFGTASGCRLLLIEVATQ
jgi:redox-sensitive bicupin YhaK (pirin superfamily)